MIIANRLAAAFVAVLVAVLGVAALTCLDARAAEYPTSPIRLIVPTPPGGGADTLARLTAQAVEPLLHTSIVVENRPGAGGSIGMNVITRANPDGYQLGFVWNSVLTTLPN